MSNSLSSQVVLLVRACTENELFRLQVELTRYFEAVHLVAGHVLVL